MEQAQIAFLKKQLKKFTWNKTGFRFLFRICFDKSCRDVACLGRFLVASFSEMSSIELSQDVVDKYNEDGAVLIKGAFSDCEASMSNLSLQISLIYITGEEIWRPLFLL